MVEEAPASNFGASVFLDVRSLVGVGAVRSVILFDLSEIPLGSIIVTAELWLYYYRYWVNNPAGRTMDIHRCLETWAEMTVTWNNQPDHDPTIESSLTVPSSPNRWMTWDVKNLVQNWVNGTYDNYGLKLKDRDEDNPNEREVRWYSKEWTELRPYLLVEYIVPSAEGCIGKQYNLWMFKISDMRWYKGGTPDPTGIPVRDLGVQLGFRYWDAEQGMWIKA